MKRAIWAGVLVTWVCGGNAANAQVITGSGNLRDDPGNTIQYKVEDLTDADGKRDVTRTVFVLELDQKLSWWKSLDLFSVAGNGETARVFRIEVHDDKKSASISVPAAQMQGAKQFEVWKAGAFNVGHCTYKTALDGTAMLGKKVTVTYVKD